MLYRLELEVAHCRADVPAILPTTVQPASKPSSSPSPAAGASSSSSSSSSSVEQGPGQSEGGPSSAGPALVVTTAPMDTREAGGVVRSSPTPDHTPSVLKTAVESRAPGSQCMPERAALIKSVLNFLKKAIPDPTFSENMRTCE